MQNGPTIKFWWNSAQNTSAFHDLLFTYSMAIELEFDLHQFKGLSEIWGGVRFGWLDTNGFGFKLFEQEQTHREQTYQEQTYQEQTYQEQNYQ